MMIMEMVLGAADTVIESDGCEKYSRKRIRV